MVRGPILDLAGPLDVHPGAVADGAWFEELLTGARASVAGGALPLPSVAPGVAIWRVDGTPAG